MWKNFLSSGFLLVRFPNPLYELENLTRCLLPSVIASVEQLLGIIGYCWLLLVIVCVPLLIYTDTDIDIDIDIAHSDILILILIYC